MKIFGVLVCKFFMLSISFVSIAQDFNQLTKEDQYASMTMVVDTNQKLYFIEMNNENCFSFRLSSYDLSGISIPKSVYYFKDSLQYAKVLKKQGNELFVCLISESIAISKLILHEDSIKEESIINIPDVRFFDDIQLNDDNNLVVYTHDSLIEISTITGYVLNRTKTAYPSKDDFLERKISNDLKHVFYLKERNGRKSLMHVNLADSHVSQIKECKLSIKENITFCKKVKTDNYIIISEDFSPSGEKYSTVYFYNVKLDTLEKKERVKGRILDATYIRDGVIIISLVYPTDYSREISLPISMFTYKISDYHNSDIGLLFIK